MFFKWKKGTQKTGGHGEHNQYRGLKGTPGTKVRQKSQGTQRKQGKRDTKDTRGHRRQKGSKGHRKKKGDKGYRRAQQTNRTQGNKGHYCTTNISLIHIKRKFPRAVLRSPNIRSHSVLFDELLSTRFYRPIRYGYLRILPEISDPCRCTRNRGLWERDWMVFGFKSDTAV